MLESSEALIPELSSARSGRGFSRHSGSIVRWSKSKQREEEVPPALPAIGSMSPTRLSLSMVASLQSPLLFGLVPTF